MTRGELIAELAVTLGARHEARFIIEEVLGTDVTLSHQPASLSDTETIRALASRRRAGEPLQYVLGHWSFRSLDLVVDPRVLIPRPETEQVVEVALREAAHLARVDPVIVDAGTGSGAIALSLATELAPSSPRGRVWATDRSAGALAVAAANLDRTRGREGCVLPVTLIEGSWLTALPGDLKGRVTLVVSNPPYVATGEWTDLPSDVRREPQLALVAQAGTDGTPGLGDVEEVLRQAARWLSRPGAVVIELAPHQAEAAAAMARAIGYQDVRVDADLAQRPRALVGRIR